jgi:hypothetical protein
MAKLCPHCRAAVPDLGQLRRRELEELKQKKPACFDLATNIQQEYNTLISDERFDKMLLAINNRVANCEWDAM